MGKPRNIRRQCSALLVTLSILGGCAQLDKAVSFQCEPILDVSAEIFGLRIISVGEVHGVKEVPTMVGNLVCQLAKRGKPVVIGVEVTSGAQADIATFLASPGAASDRAAMLGNKFWTGKDGRASVAMVALIDHVRAMRAGRLDVDVLAFDVDWSSGVRDSRTRDEVMADNIADSIRRHPNKTFVLLSGNYHASKQEVFGHDAAFRSMAYRLNQRFPVSTFNADFEKGTAWNCRGATAASMRCEAWPTSGTAPEWPRPSIKLDATMMRRKGFPDYDGSLFVGRSVVASPPALPE